MAKHRTILTTAAIVLTCAVLYLSNPNSLFTSSTMSTKSQIPLTVTIAPSSTSQSILGSATLLIKLTNTSPNDIYILRWSSPLDPSLPGLGLVKFTSASTGLEAPCLDMKINHRLPPDETFSIEDESIERIPASGSLERVVEFKEPKIALEKGEEYRVQARGNWMGVWIGKGGNGGGLTRLKMGEVDGMKTGEWESNEIVMRVPGDGDSELKE